MPRRILRLRRFFEGPSPWALIAIAGMAFVIVSLYVVNHNAVARNERLLAQQRLTLVGAQRAVEYLCETNQTLDLLVKQFIATGLRTLTADQLLALSTAHIVLSDTRACRKVTG